MIPAFSKLKQIDRVLQQLQTNIAATLDPLIRAPATGAVIATFTASADVAANTDITIANPLGQSPAGIISMLPTVSTSMPATFPPTAQWIQSNTASPNASQFIILQCTAALAKGAGPFNFLVF